MAARRLRRVVPSASRVRVRSPGGARISRHPTEDQKRPIYNRHLEELAQQQRTVPRQNPSRARTEPNQNAKEAQRVSLFLSLSPHPPARIPLSSDSGDSDLQRSPLRFLAPAARPQAPGLICSFIKELVQNSQPDRAKRSWVWSEIESGDREFRPGFACQPARLHELFRQSGTQLQLQPLRRLPPHLPPAFLPAAAAVKSTQFQFQSHH